jgi:AraC-like DNA-binding protein
MVRNCHRSSRLRPPTCPLQAGGLARIAATIGYSDQAHLTRETRDLSGHSPVALERALGALRDERASGTFKTGAQRAGGARGLS